VRSYVYVSYGTSPKPRSALVRSPHRSSRASSAPQSPVCAASPKLIATDRFRLRDRTDAPDRSCSRTSTAQEPRRPAPPATRYPGNRTRSRASPQRAAAWRSPSRGRRQQTHCARGRHSMRRRASWRRDPPRVGSATGSDSQPCGAGRRLRFPPCRGRATPGLRPPRLGQSPWLKIDTMPARSGYGCSTLSSRTFPTTCVRS
jgi:hypothetical protein